jgi:DNA replication initiation complex subunit (GINS family)
MELDSNSLGELLRKERTSPSLQPVIDGFYKELGLLLNEMEKRYPPFSREGENLRNLVNGIFNTREKKIVLFAISFARSDEEMDVENATPEETVFLQDLIKILKQRRESLSGKENKKKKAEKKKDIPTSPKIVKAEVKNTNVKKDGKITLRILQDLPPIVGSDGKTYGEFKTEDIVALPEKNGKLFLKHGYGEVIDFDL